MLLLLLQATSRSAAQAGSALKFRWVDSLVRVQSDSHGLPGVGVSIVRGGQPVLVRAYGTTDVHTREPVTVTTPFNIASFTKSFTAIAVARLVREGKLSLDLPVRQYLRWWPDQYAGITARQLLHHTSGIVRDIRLSNEDDPDAATYRARLVTSQPSARPGERFEYSNTGYTVLGWLVEELAGGPLEGVLRQQVFQPFKMHQARYRQPINADPRRARPHNVEGGRPQPVAYVTGGFGSGGISLSINDLARFATAMQQEKVWTTPWRDTAWTPGRLADGVAVVIRMFGDSASYGFGWFIGKYQGRMVATHAGGINGYSSMFLHFPREQLTIAVLANARAPVEPIVLAIADRCLVRDQCS